MGLQKYRAHKEKMKYDRAIEELIVEIEALIINKNNSKTFFGRSVYIQAIEKKEEELARFRRLALCTED